MSSRGGDRFRVEPVLGIQDISHIMRKYELQTQRENRLPLLHASMYPSSGILIGSPTHYLVYGRQLLGQSYTFQNGRMFPKGADNLNLLTEAIEAGKENVKPVQKDSINFFEAVRETLALSGHLKEHLRQLELQLERVIQVSPISPLNGSTSQNTITPPSSLDLNCSSPMWPSQWSESQVWDDKAMNNLISHIDNLQVLLRHLVIVKKIYIPEKTYNNTNNNTIIEQYHGQENQLPLLIGISMVKKTETKKEVLMPLKPSKREKKKPVGTKERRKRISKQLASKDFRCQHCGEVETPEWRKGPYGSKSICNACGLFYKKLKTRFGTESAGEVMLHRKSTGEAFNRFIPATLSELTSSN